MKKFTVIQVMTTIIALGAVGCAKERPVKRISDANAARFEKAAFLRSPVWLQKVTIVKTGEQSAFGFVGLQSEVRPGRFEFEKDQLKFVNASSLYENSESTSTLINAWNVNHSDRRLAEVNGRVTNVEEENTDLQWYEKRFFVIDWDTAQISERASFPFSIDRDCWSKTGSSLVLGSERVEAEHITFTVAVDYEIDENCLNNERYNVGAFTHTLHFKYSFIPLPETDYAPYLYTGENDPLMRKYGYFNKVIEGLGADGRTKNSFVMNRWHPEKVHTFYFAEDFPESIKPIYNDPETGIIKRTNDLFERNGVNVRFEVKDNDGSKKFGDLRYSFFKVVEQLDPGAPLGFGPSDANPFTGEIISANTVMWTGYLKYQLEKLSEQLERDKKSFETSSLYLSLQSTLGTNKADWTSTAAALAPDTDARKYFNFLLPQYTFGYSGNGYAHNDPPLIYKSSAAPAALDMLKTSASDEFRSFLTDLQTENASDLEKMNKTKFTSLTTTAFEWEQPLADGYARLQEGATVDDTMNKVLFSTAIHEFGHNLNLRHNFYGSVDSVHFGDKTAGYAHLSSSVMEYMSLKDDDHAGYGQYDEAALVYAYSSGAKDLAKDKSTTYLYCSDEHASINAMCNRWDKGTTPSEIAVSLIDRYEDMYWLRNFRNGRAYWSTGSYNWSIFSTMWDFKKFVKMGEDTFELSDFKEKLSNFKDLDNDMLEALNSDIQKDMKQAALIAASFYDSVMQLRFTDRSYTESFDSWSGALQQKGIASDKIYASIFLLGDDAIAYDPNVGTSATSFLPLREDPIVGTKIADIVRRNVMDSGDMYLGFDSFSRVLYARSAVGYRNISGFGSSLEQLRIACFAPDTFELRFNVADVYNFAQAGQSPHVLAYEEIPLTNLNANADYYLRDPTDTVAVININGNFYVSSLKYNELSFELMQSQVRHEILEMYMVYRMITEGRIPECL